MNEIWKEHPNYKGIFISSLGRCKRVFHNRETIYELVGNRYSIKYDKQSIKIVIESIFPILFPQEKVEVRYKNKFVDSETEVWKDIEGYENLYQVSDLGRLRRLGRYNKRNFYQQASYIKPTLSSSKYLAVWLTNKNGQRTNHSVHRIVGLMFVNNPHNKPFMNHLDGNKLNNRANNLEWSTKQKNNQHAWDTGLQTKRCKTGAKS